MLESSAERLRQQETDGMKVWTTILVLAMALISLQAEAKRLGGGKPMGQQSSNVTQREAAKPAPAATPNAAPAAAPHAPAAPAAPAAAPSRFGGMGGMLGGLAAGLGLAWLAHSMGFGAEFGQFLMFGLLALVVMMVIGAIMRRRQQPEANNTSPYAFEGAGAPANPSTLPQYNPKNVGNDSSARPMDTQTNFSPAAGGSMIGSALGGSQTWGYLPTLTPQALSTRPSKTS
jgi:type IV secretory pathway VirB10-like protein